MNPQTFFEHFERLADAPNAVARLRELILQLAVQGKLVKQDEHDESASTLLEKIRADKARLIKEKKIGVDELSPLIEAGDEPFRLPTGWRWVHLNQITNTIHYGYTAAANHSLKGVRLLRITDIQNGKVDWDSVPGCEIDKDKVKGVELRDGDLLIARTGGTIGKSFLVENVSVRAVFASYLIRAIPNKFLSPKYLKLFLESELYWRQLYAKSMGTGQPNVNATSLKSLLVPLPPFEEQKRIVAKVDELMRLCDELEREQAERRAVRSHLNRAALDGLLAASDAAAFSTRWQTVCDHFATLTATPDLLGKLRQTVLQLAVQGKLTHQDPKDESATSLLCRIRAEKERLIKEKRLKHADLLPDVIPDETPFDLPSRWSWVRMGDCALILGGKRLPNGASFAAVPTPRIYIQVTNMKRGTIVQDNIKYIDEDVFGEISKYIIEKDDLYITIAGTIGQVGDVPEFFHGMNLTENAARIIFRVLDKHYLLLALESKSTQQQFREKTNQQAQPKLALKRIASAVIPLPPLEEQKRIVAAVKRLMTLCDELEVNLRRSEEDGEQLLRAAVRSLLTSTIENSSAESAAFVVQ